jgi:glutathione synthase/RimK-type ligase-like ATP-grasp enzyme
MKRVGLLVGRERSFPEALIEEVARRGAGVVAELASFEATRADEAIAYDVLVDRISHDVPCYQPTLKLAVLQGVRVVNNPFWRIADDKFLGTALARELGVAVPKTVVLPAKAYGPDITSGSLRNLRWVDWDRIESELGGYPMYLKPHWGGGWRDVHRVRSRDDLFDKYATTGEKTMILQQGIEWQQYVRCVVIGREAVLPALWDPRLGHFDRYQRAHESMAPLSPELETLARANALTLCRALGYDMNTVELAISNGVPYAIDFMNSAPDFDITSLGDAHFGWVVREMASLVIRLALAPRGERTERYSWDALLRG